VGIFFWRGIDTASSNSVLFQTVVADKEHVGWGSVFAVPCPGGHSPPAELESPALRDLAGAEMDAPVVYAESSDPAAAESIRELLADQLRDILHAEKQLLKALPKMAKAARSTPLQALLQTHLGETEAQVERLNESLQMLGVPARAKRWE